MSYCNECEFYKVSKTDGPFCSKDSRKRPVSPIQSKCLFEEEPGAGDAEVPSILANVPDKSTQEESKPARKGRGRKKEFENYVDEETGVTMKYCRKCKMYKPILAFYTKPDTADGFAFECKECHLSRCKVRQKEKRAARREAAGVAFVMPEDTDIPVDIPETEEDPQVAEESADLCEIKVAIRKFEVLDPIPGGFVEIVLLAQQEDMNATGLLPLAGKVLTVKFGVK